MTARMLISLQNEQTGYLTQRVNSKTTILGLDRLNVDFMLKPDSKDVDFTSKRANWLSHAARKLKNSNFWSK